MKYVKSKQINIGRRGQVWVSWSAGDPLIANMQELIGTLRMLAGVLQDTQMILLSGTQTMNRSNIHIRDHNVENGLGEITN